MTVTAEVQGGISRYLTEVATYLDGRTPEEKRELLAEVESHIHEALSRCGHEPTPPDLEAVLAEMAPPESYAVAGREGEAQGQTPASRPQSGATLAKWALAFAIGGCVVPLALGAIASAFSPHADGGAAIPLLPVMELVALALGIASWKYKAGKAAAITAAGLLVAGLIAFGIFALFFIKY
jgi:hypothetical protein